MAFFVSIYQSFREPRYGGWVWDSAKFYLRTGAGRGCNPSHHDPAFGG